jgi:cytochrome P450 family 71 subfamily A
METLQANELFAGLLLVLVTIFLIKQLLPASSNKRRTASPSLPRPRGFPIIGNLHQLGTLPHKNLAALSTRLGAPLMLLRLGSVPALVISTADTRYASCSSPTTGPCLLGLTVGSCRRLLLGSIVGFC